MLAPHNRQHSTAQMRSARLSGQALNSFVRVVVSRCVPDRRYQRLAVKSQLQLQSKTSTSTLGINPRGDFANAGLRIQRISNRCKPYLGRFGAGRKPVFEITAKNGATKDGNLTQPPAEQHKT